jgi:hypothetical protein
VIIIDSNKLIEVTMLFHWGIAHNNRPPHFLLLKKKIVSAGNTKGGSITVPLTSCLTGLDQSVLQTKTKIVSCHTANSKPVKQEVNGTVILPPYSIPWFQYENQLV